MTFNFWSWLGLICNLTTIAVTLAFLIIIVGLGRRHPGNLSFALFLSLIFGFIGSGQFTQVLLWLGQGNPSLSLEASGAFFFLQGTVLFYFAGRLIGLTHHPWFNLSAGIGLVTWLAGLIPLSKHQIITNPRLSPTGLLRWDTSFLGYSLVVLSFAFLMAALLLLLTHRRQLPHPSLAVGVGVIVVSEVIGLSGALRLLPVPLLTLGITAGIVILGSSMVYFQLLRPLNDMTRKLQAHRAELEERNRRLEEANIKLRESDEWRGKITHMLIHDLKNSLNVIHVVLNEFKTSFSAHMDDAQRKFLESALGSAYRAQGLISSMLHLRRLEEGHLPIRLTPFDLAPIIDKCVQQVDPLLSLHKITVDTNVPTQAILAYADPAITTRIIENLLDNAIKFSPSPGTIAIRVRPGPDEVQFSIIDSGPGIPPTYHQQIFDRFFQITPPSRGIRSGVGLGLTFCKLAVEAQGGRIWVESEGRDGATFHFTLSAWKNSADESASPLCHSEQQV